jgi:thiol reductant ABC exporter CydC subunit
MGGRLTVAALAAVAAELASLGLIAAAAWLIARAAEQPALTALSVAIVAVRAFATSRGVFRYAERLAGHDVALRAQAATRERLYRALVPAGPLRRRGADLLSRMVDDTDAVQDLLVRCLLPAVAALLTAVAAVLVAVFLLPASALVLLAGLLAAGLVLPAATLAAARRWSARVAPARAELATRVADLVHGSADLLAYGAERDALAAAGRADANLSRLERGQSRVNAAALGAGLFLQGLTVVLVTLTAQAGGADRVATAVLALVALVSFEPVLPLAAAAERLAGVVAALSRLREVRATPPAVASVTSSARPGHSGPATRPELPRGGGPLTVEVAGLVVRHSPDRPPALDGVGLSLAPGRRVALVGPSGAGKSTLLAALMRLVEYESGVITLGGVDIRALPPEAVRERVTGLTQDPYVFRATLRDNLRLAAPDADDATLRAAVERARLGAWVERIGWDAELGEDARTVSGGQLQRLALARALLYDPGVLLLDEPTEALDEPTADALMADLLAATEGRTTLLVTHRLRGLDQVDEIIVLENGRVVQRGTHDVLARTPGYYHDLLISEALRAPA